MRTTNCKIKFLKPFLLALAGLALVLAMTACQKRSATGKPDDVDYYTCAMHPSVRKFSPADKCPICSMDLVPVMKRGLPGTNAAQAQISGGMAVEAKPGEFSVPVDRLRQIGVTYAEVGMRQLTNTVRAVGTVAYDKQRHWDYVARVEGYVKDLSVFSRGELVEKDAPLLTIYSPDLLTTQTEFVDLLKARDDAQAKGGSALLASTTRLLESARRRLRLWNITAEQIDDLERTRKPAETLTLISPFKGVVQDLLVDQGRRVMAGDHLVDIADLSVVWVWAQFYQDDVALLEKGLPVMITTSSQPGEKFDGRISVVDPFINSTSRTARVRIDVANPGLKLRPDMYVDAELVLDMGQGVAVPFNAVLPTGRHNVVFVSKVEGRLEPRYVELGRKYGDFYEVKSGLLPDERVVTSANFLIDAEAKVQGVLKSW